MTLVSMEICAVRAPRASLNFFGGQSVGSSEPRVLCTENSARIDYVSKSPNVSIDDHSVLPLPGPARLAVQVEEPT
jgi:hypothetical protein